MFVPRPDKVRLICFGIGLVMLTALIAWAARTSWRQFGEMEQGIHEEELGSFQIADAFQAKIQGLNYTLVRFGTQETTAQRQHFERQSRELNQWIDHQKTLLTTPREREVLDRIDRAYDSYLTAARQVIAIAEESNNPKMMLEALEKSSYASQPLFELGSALANANREARREWREDLRRSLGNLQKVIIASLLCLLVFGGGVVGFAYRQLIAPLHLQLAESKGLVARQEKLASLGVLAAGVAHEIRNPLTAIKVRLFTLRNELAQGSADGSEDIEVISSEINRLERIVKDVLQFARPSEPNLERLHCSELLNEVRDLMNGDFSTRAITISIAVSGDACVRADPQQLKQVLINLMRNAGDAMGGNGKLMLRARVGTGVINKARLRCVFMEVEDNGVGIPPEIQKRLFDPFFSTKETGTGLGLSIAARIVEHHRGVLRFSTRVNEGTTFSIVLPFAET